MTMTIMKKLLSTPVTILSCLLLCSSLCFSAAIIQSNDGGNASGSFSTGGTLTTTAVGFSSATASGNTLYMPVWIREESSNADCAINPSTGITITTSGFTWTAAPTYNAFADSATETHCGLIKYYYIVGAASMPTSTTTTIAVAVPSGEHCTCSIEFALYEISGVSAFLNDNGTPPPNDTGTASTPECNTTVSGTEIYFCNLIGYPGSNLTAASGYTIGVNATVATIGQTSYDLAVTGTTNPNYSGTLTLWATFAAAFSLSSSPASVPRHRGFVN
jgi:hypothetical protein